MTSRHHRLCLPFAVPPDVKAAQVSVLPEFDSAEPFPREHWPQLESFQPGVLIGYGYDLERLADAVERSAVVLTTVDRAIYALTDCGMHVMTDALRQKLWKTFGVPLYELLIAPGSMVLAAECELHSGWHLQQGIAAEAVDGEIVYGTKRLKHAHTWFTGALDSTPCECGRSTPRLRDLAPWRRMPQSNTPALLRAS